MLVGRELKDEEYWKFFEKRFHNLSNQSSPNREGEETISNAEVFFPASIL